MSHGKLFASIDELKSIYRNGLKMAKRSTKEKGLTNPLRLAPRDPRDSALIRVIIETPKGSRNKYAFDAKQRIFQLKKVLPAGMAFPYDFGFIPSTIADDGDPVDVLVLTDEPAFPGCLLACRLIGIIEGEQVRRNSERDTTD